MPAPPSALLVSPADNVAVAVRGLQPGETVVIDGRAIVCGREIPIGHKLAVSVIEAGEKVLKCGVPIGMARQRVEVGDHVHTHNLVSTYIADH